MTGWRDMQQGRDAQHAEAAPVHTTDVVRITPTAFAFCCGCGTSGPLRPTREEAQQDAARHPSPKI